MMCESCLELLVKLCRFKQAVIKSHEILMRHTAVAEVLANFIVLTVFYTNHLTALLDACMS